MEITRQKNIEIQGKHEKPILADFFYTPTNQPKPVVIFCHGYKGFKDWGAWDKMGDFFAEAGYFFVKFNFSHNGTTPEKPTEFLDVEAFGDNNYSIELDDLQSMIDHILLPDFNCAQLIDPSNIGLIGHSRGGGIVVIKAAEENRINKLITFSSVSDFGERFPEEEELEKWEEKGVRYILNTRTNQKLPHHYQFYTNFKENEERLTISRAAKALEIPLLIVHGSSDVAVPISASGKLFEWSTFSELLLVENADHVYGITHPWNEPEVSKDFKYVLEKTIEFMDTPQDELLRATEG